VDRRRRPARHPSGAARRDGDRRADRRYRFDGKTDPQIVRELLELAGHPECSSEDRITAVCQRYVDLLTAELAKPTQATRIYPGINDLLAALEPYEAEHKALVGLLTGNVEQGAAMKLRRLASISAVLQSGRLARTRTAARTCPRSLPSAPRSAPVAASAAPTSWWWATRPDDIACARPMGGSTLGVATGFYDTQALRAAARTHVFETLGDTRAVLDALFS